MGRKKTKNSNNSSNNSKNNKKNKIQLRGIFRKGPICYMLSSCQLLNYIQWDNIFDKYAKTYKDIWAETMHLIFEITGIKNNPIHSNIGYRLAQRFEKFANTYRKSSDPAGLWKCDEQQDAFEYLRYFFNMIIDLTKPKEIPNILTKNEQIEANKKIEAIEKMQNFITDTFIFKTAKYFKCQTSTYVNKEEQHFVLTLPLPNRNKSVTLQQLIDDLFTAEKIKDVKCRICKTKHDNKSIYKFKELKNKYILINLVRFYTRYNSLTNEYFQGKKFNHVSIDLPVVFKVQDGYEVYQIVAGINHVDGSTTKSGHYTTDKYFNGKIHNCNDEKVNPNILNFNAKNIYIGLLERVDNLQQKTDVITKYKLDLKKISQQNQQKKSTHSKHSNNKKRNKRSNDISIKERKTKKRKKNPKTSTITNINNNNQKYQQQQKLHNNIPNVLTSTSDDSDVQILSKGPKEPQISDDYESIDSQDYTVNYEYENKNGVLMNVLMNRQHVRADELDLILKNKNNNNRINNHIKKFPIIRSKKSPTYNNTNNPNQRHRRQNHKKILSTKTTQKNPLKQITPNKFKKSHQTNSKNHTKKIQIITSKKSHQTQTYNNRNPNQQSPTKKRIHNNNNNSNINSSNNKKGNIYFIFRYKPAEMKKINNHKNKTILKILFGDNDVDKNRKANSTRIGNGGQAKIIGKYDRSFAYGITTTFYKMYYNPSENRKCYEATNPPDLQTFKNLMDTQFEPLKQHLNKGYDIWIPKPHITDIQNKRISYYSNGKQVIYHNIGTGIANLPISHLLYIQSKINELTKHTRTTTITNINDNNTNQQRIQKHHKKVKNKNKNKNTSKKSSITTKNKNLIQSLIKSPGKHYQQQYQPQYQQQYQQQNKPQLQQYQNQYKQQNKAQLQQYKLDYDKKNPRKKKSTKMPPNPKPTDETWINEVWDANDIPTDEQLEHADFNIIWALWRFLLMRGIAQDRREEPNFDQKCNVKKILEKWKEQMNPSVPFRICGTCGICDIMTKDDYTLVTPGKRNALSWAKAKIKDLPPPNSARYKAMNLVVIKGIIYHLVEKGVEKNGTVVCCKTCTKSIPNANKTGRAPKHTVAHYDLGKIPAHLKPLTPIEKLAISRAVLFVPVYKFVVCSSKQEDGSWKTMWNEGIKGYCFCIKISKEETRDSITKGNDLPRNDLSNYIKIVIHGEKGKEQTAKRLARKHKLTLNLKNMIAWLKWLKAIGNPEYQDVKIPQTEEEIRKKQNMLNKTVDTIINEADESNDYTVNKLGEHSRANALDSILAQNDDAIIRNVLITEEPNQEKKAMDVVVEGIHRKLTIRLKNELYNEYTENHLLMSHALPDIFPLGIPQDTWKKGIIPEKMRQTWFLFWDRRCAESKDFTFLCFDQGIRHARNRQISWQIKRKGKREENFIKLCNSKDFVDTLKKAKKDLKSAAAKEIKKAIAPFIKIIDRKVPWSPLERGDILGKFYSMHHFFGVGTHFLTISPAMRHNVLAVRLAYTDATGKQFKLPDIITRTKKIINNSIAAVHIFYRVIHKFFEIIVGLPLEYYKGRKANVDRLLQANKNKFWGPYGRINATLGVVEEQSGGSLHFHGILFSGWDINVIRRHIHKPEVAKKFADLIDSQVTCEISAEIKAKYPLGKMDFKEQCELSTKSYPEIEDISNDSGLLAMALNHHEHTQTCWKYNAQYCRMGMPQRQTPKTFFAEIHYDETTKKPVRKCAGSGPGHEKISDPPPISEDGNPFKYPDTRKITFAIKATDAYEQLQPPQTPLCTSCLRCNTSMQILAAPSQARSACWYIAKYISKNPYELIRIVPLIWQAMCSESVYGSKAPDNGTATRKATCILQKTAHKSGVREVGDQQAGAAAMGLPSFFASHLFWWIHPWTFVKQHHDKVYQDDFDVDALQPESDDEDDDYAILEREVDTKKAIGISDYEKYTNRGDELKNLCPYLWTAIIGFETKPKKNKNEEKNEEKNNSTTGAGRPDNNRFYFKPGSKAAKCFVQLIRSLGRIPRIAKGKPPRYPGNPPDEKESEEQYKTWANKAQTFVEFYSLLFLPLDKDHLPFDPTQPNVKILPWNDFDDNDEPLDSWNNFWKIFGSWDIPVGKDSTNQLYKRSMWQIFTNMVDNLNQGNGDRRLLNDWRFEAAQARPSHIQSDPSERIHSKNYDNDEDEINDMEAIRLIINTRNGNSTKTTNQTKKMDQYLKKQINKFEEVEKYDNHASQKKNFPKFNFKDCKELEQKDIKSAKQMEIDDSDDEMEDGIEANCKVCFIFF